MATCPYCAEEIQELAIKCKHCKEWLPKPEPAQNAPDWELCPDGRCTGRIYDGICSVCGLSVDARVANNTDITHKDKYIERNVHGDIISTNEHHNQYHTSGKNNGKLKIFFFIIIGVLTFLVVVPIIANKREYNIFTESIDKYYEQIIANKENAPKALEIINKFEKHDLLNYKDVASIKEEMQAAALKAKEEAEAASIKAKEEAEAVAIKAKEDEMRLDAFVYMQQFVRGNLLSPRGAKFARASVYWRQHVQYLGDGRYLVRSYVDAQNAFGGTIRQNYTGVISKKDDKWELEYLDM